jgi:hypothetical protein
MRSHAQPIRMRRYAAQPLRDRKAAHSPIRSHAQRCAAGDTIENHPLRERIPAFEGRYCAPIGHGAADLPEQASAPSESKSTQKPPSARPRWWADGRRDRDFLSVTHFRHEVTP